MCICEHLDLQDFLFFSLPFDQLLRDGCLLYSTDFRGTVTSCKMKLKYSQTFLNIC